MLPIIIKKIYGFSIDYRFPEGPCPRCGGEVYHIYDDDYVVFCTAPFCKWHDRTFYSKWEL